MLANAEQDWSKMAHWTLDEAVALSFGKAPELVHWQIISKYVQLSRFAVEYQRRRELAVMRCPSITGLE